MKHHNYLRLADERMKAGVMAMRKHQFEDADSCFEKAILYIGGIMPLDLQTDYSVLRMAIIIAGYQARTAEFMGDPDRAAGKYSEAVAIGERIRRILHKKMAVDCFSKIQKGAWPEDNQAAPYRPRIDHLIHLWQKGEETAKNGHQEEALAFYEMSILGREALLKKTSFAPEEIEAFQTVLSNCCVAAGDLSLALMRNNSEEYFLNRAEEYYTRSKDILFEQWQGDYCLEDVREQLSDCCIQLGKIAKYRNEYTLADSYYSSALALLKSIEFDYGKPMYGMRLTMIELEQWNIQILKECEAIVISKTGQKEEGFTD